MVYGGISGVKKVLAVVVALVAILAAAVVALPSLIDWNAYRDQIAQRVEALTGREMAIGGDISISLLPTPALVANDVRMANIEGAAAPTMVAVKSMEVRISLGPLFGGTVEVETVRMVDPVIELERLANGRVNWEFAQPGAGDAAAGGAPRTGTSGDSDRSVRLDNFLIENGTIVFRDTQQGVTERLEQVNARLAAVSLSGPLDSAGDLHYRGVPLSYELSLGRVIEGRTVPLNMVVMAEERQAKAELSGALVDLAESPRFKGKVVAASSGLAGLIDEMFGPGSVPAFLAKPFRIEGEVQASKIGLEMQEMLASLGEMRASGSISAAFEDTVAVDVKLTAGRIDLDAIMAADAAAKPEPERKEGAGKGARNIPVASPEEDGGFAIPEGINGNFEFLAEAVTFNGGIVSEARVVASLSGGEVTVSQLSALLPGGSDVFATGFLTAEEGEPKFDGNLDAKISDLRRVLVWLGIQEPEVPSDRLRQASFKGRIVADSEKLQGINLDVTIDTSRITGGITLALRKRLAFGANLKVNRINLDAYLEPEGGKAAGKPSPQPLATGPAGDQGGAGQAAEPVAFLEFLTRFDANLKLQVGNLTYHRVPLGDIALDATLFGGALDVREASIGDLAGAKGKLSGKLAGLTQIPEFDGVHFTLAEIDLPRLLRLFAVEAPPSAKELGIATVRGRADGAILRPEMDLIVETRDVSADLAGRFSILPVEPLFSGDLKFSHKDLSQLLRLFDVAYRPVGRVGGFGVAAKVKAAGDSVQFDSLTAKVGTVEAKGTLSVDLTGPRPRVVADLEAGNVEIDPFLPAQGRASRGGAPSSRKASLDTGLVHLAAWRPGGALPVAANTNIRQVAAASARWSAEPIDLTALQAFDAELKLKAASVKYTDATLLQAVSEATITDGVLRVNSLTGKLFGGDFKGIATIRSAPKPAVTGSVSLAAADFGALEKALRGERLASGNVGFRVTFSTTGLSEAAMISDLEGEGSFEIQKVAISGDPEKSRRGAISGLLSGLDQVVGALTGGKRPEGLADMSGTFTIKRGIAHSEDLRFLSSAGEGVARGDVDLPAWQMKVGGDVQLSQNLLSQLLSGATGMKVTVPFRIEGALDEPNVIIDTGRLPGKVLKIPGELLDKSGVGDVIKRLIPR